MINFFAQNFFFINKIIIILMEMFGLYLAFWVYSANPKLKLNQLFALMVLIVLLWMSFCYFSGALYQDMSLSLLFARLAYGTTILFFVPFYFFSLRFIEKKEKIPLLKILIPVGAVAIFFLSVFSNFIVKGMILPDIGINFIGALPILGKGAFLYFGFAIFVSLLILIRFFKKYFESFKKVKIQVQYFLLGLSIFIIFHFVFNIILPSIEGGIPRFYYIGNYSIFFLLGFTAYAIIKRELFGMKVVLTSIFAGLITVLLVIDTVFLTPVFLHQLFKLLLLIIFIYFGYRLIKSVLDEIQKRKELEDLTLRLEKANIELRKLDKAKSEFLSIASHQLRTPLTAIKGYISMILDGDYGKMNSKIEKTVQNIYNSNERLVKLVNNLLNVSKIESGKIKMNFEEIQLEDVISETVSELKIKAEEKKLKIHWNKPKSAWPLVSADRSRIKQVFLNVVDNAIKYTKKGSISIKIDIQDEKYIIEISDTGCGVPKEDFHRLFYSFTRGETGFLDHTEGAGLGLYIAKKFVEAHKGKIWVESQGRNKGSTFYIELPIKK